MLGAALVVGREISGGLFRIAGISVELEGLHPYSEIGLGWENFAIYPELSEATDITMQSVFPESTSYCVEHYILLEDVRQVFHYGSDVLLTDRDFCHCVMVSPKDPASFTVLSNHLFYTHAARRQMVQLHCATVDDQGRGILFLGPSGIGKTTQAERWAQYRGSSIINGDIGLVQRTDDGYVAWGTPWHGSSPYCLNASVPVKALVVLKQAPENRLRELTGFEKVSEVSGSVFYPTWLEGGMELCTDTLNHLLTDLPVYRLDNRADEDAVNLLAAELDRIS